jgi:Rhodopirellula transposase DDE domain
MAASRRARTGGVHDFPDPELGKAIPYRVYDLGANAGWVSVGLTTTPPLSRWQRCGAGGSRPVGRVPTATRLLVTADAGGSNGYRVRAWKTELARFAAETGPAVTVCHFPPGTSKLHNHTQNQACPMVAVGCGP